MLNAILVVNSLHLLLAQYSGNHAPSQQRSIFRHSTGSVGICGLVQPVLYKCMLSVFILVTLSCSGIFFEFLTPLARIFVQKF
uniref:Putative secreted protein n=1 Tax=Amblyomma parvum TaxID=251391 RepID=A0A023FZY4_AMBPA